MRYARALMLYAAKQGAQKQVYTDAHTMAASYAAYPALSRVMENRLVDTARKREVLLMCSGGDKVSEYFIRFIDLVLVQGRENFLRVICLDYIALMRREQNITDVEVITAAAMGEKELKLFEEKLRMITGGDVIVRSDVDPALIGGYILRWNDYRLDRSVSGRLKQIEKMLVK